MNFCRDDRSTPVTRILLADDDRISRHYLLRMLQQLGLRVRAAAAGQHVLRLTSTKVFSALLLDYHLPDLDAPELIRRLRLQAGNRLACPPVVVITAGISPTQRRQLASLAVQELLPKPVEFGRLRECLGRLQAPLLTAEAVMAKSRPIIQTAHLRRLLQAELAELAHCIAQPSGLAEDLIPRLHRLRASCSLCGTPALARCAAILESQLRQGQPPSALALQELQRQITLTGQALAELNPQDPRLPNQ